MAIAKTRAIAPVQCCNLGATQTYYAAAGPHHLGRDNRSGNLFRLVSVQTRVRVRHITHTQTERERKRERETLSLSLSLSVCVCDMPCLRMRMYTVRVCVRARTHTHVRERALQMDDLTHIPDTALHMNKHHHARAWPGACAYRNTQEPTASTDLPGQCVSRWQSWWHWPGTPTATGYRIRDRAP